MFVFETSQNCSYLCKPGPYSLKVKIIASTKFKINLIFHFVEECKKNMLKEKIDIKVTIISKFRTLPRLKMNNSSENELKQNVAF